MTGQVTPIEKLIKKGPIYDYKMSLKKGQEIDAPPPVPTAPENDPAAKAAADEEARLARMRAGKGIYDTLATSGGYAGDTSKTTTAAKTLLGK